MCQRSNKDRIHNYNTKSLVYTLLPYHESPLFLNLLEILPKSVPPELKFLNPYVKATSVVPRHAVIYSATNNDAFFDGLNAHLLSIDSHDFDLNTFVSFWATVAAEGLSGRLSVAQSGRKEVQRQRQEDVARRILPILDHGLASQHQDFRTACHAMVIVLASKGNVSDAVLDSIHHSILLMIGRGTSESSFISLSVSLSHRSEIRLPQRGARELLRRKELISDLSRINVEYDLTPLITALVFYCAKIDIKFARTKQTSFITRALQSNLVTPKIANATLAQLLPLVGGDPTSDSVKHSIEVVRLLLETETLRDTLMQTASNIGVNMESLESDLQALLAEKRELPVTDRTDIDDSVAYASQKKSSTADILAHLPQRTVNMISFFEDDSQSLYNEFASAFRVIGTLEQDTRLFMHLPFWASGPCGDESLVLTFLFRIACSQELPQHRALALHLASQRISEHDKNLDWQACFPFVLACLADDNVQVRREASQFLTVLRQQMPQDGIEGEIFPRWASETLYGTSSTQSLKWLPSREILKVLDLAFLPFLEDMTLDSARTSQVLSMALGGEEVESSANGSPALLKKNTRRGFLAFLCSHVLTTSSWRLRLQLINLLPQAGKAASSIQPMLAPVVKQWASLDKHELAKISKRDGIQRRVASKVIVGLIGTGASDLFHSILLCLTTSSGNANKDLQFELFSRLRHLWKSMDSEQQINTASEALNAAHDNTQPDFVRAIGAEFLQSISLPTAFLTKAMDAEANRIWSQPADHGVQSASPNKRRRLSHTTAVVRNGQENILQDIIRRLTFMLELVDQSNNGQDVSLVHSLFTLLAAVRQSSLFQRNEQPYVLDLILGNILRIAKAGMIGDALRSRSESIRPTLLIDCVQKVQNPQIRNTALAVIANVARVAPDLIVHEIMPVFTTMGQQLIEADTEISERITDQVIDQIVPPLMASLRKTGDDIVLAASDIILSFVAAFEHIPPHRRLQLFKSLLAKLGTEDFSAIVLVMLAVRYGSTLATMEFSKDILTSYASNTQWIILHRYASIVSKFHTQPSSDVSTRLLDIPFDDFTARARAKLGMVQLLFHLITISKYQGVEAHVKELQDLQSTLEITLRLHSKKEVEDETWSVIGRSLQALLEKPKLPDFLQMIEAVVGRGEDTLSRKILLLATTRIRQMSTFESRDKLFTTNFMSFLCCQSNTTRNEALRIATIACIDALVQNIGRKEPTACKKAVNSMIAICKVPNRVVKSAAVLSISSSVEILKDTVLSELPQILEVVCDTLKTSMQDEDQDIALHDASLSLLLSITAHVPYAIAGTDLALLLDLCAESASLASQTESIALRRSFLELLSSKMDFAILIRAVHKSWASFVENDVAAVTEVVTIVGQAIGSSSKSTVIASTTEVKAFLLCAYDLRRVQLTERTEDAYPSSDVALVEDLLNDVTMKFVYKLNDGLLRPVFAEFVEWSGHGHKVSHNNREVLRRTTLFRFSKHFFSTLKSIVTSYASYIIEPTNQCFTAVNDRLTQDQRKQSLTFDDDNLDYLRSCLGMLREAFAFDADAFFATPAHFDAIAQPLIMQLHNANGKGLGGLVSEDLIPTIVAFATAVMDNVEHHKTVNHYLCGLRGAEAAAVRMASIKCQQALADSESVGEEWLNSCMSSGEGLVYINEMLEDDDEDIEREVRRFVRNVRSVLGEDYLAG